MTRFKRLSKSRGITIPKDMAVELDFGAGTALDLTAESGKLIVTRHVDTCRFCGEAERVKRFGDIFVCSDCAVKLHKEVCGS